MKSVMKSGNHPSTASNLKGALLMSSCAMLGACAQLEEPAADEPQYGEVSAELGATVTVGAIGYTQAVSYDATNAYFTQLAGEFCAPFAELRKMSLSTGVLTTLQTGCNSPAQSASDGTNLFFSALSTGDVRRIPVAGGASVSVASSPGTLYGTGLVLDATRIYYSNGATVQRVAKTGGAVLTVYTGAGFQSPRVIAVDATNVYFDISVSSPFAYELRKAPIGGGASILLHSSPNSHSQAVLQGGNLYWANNPSGSTSILRMSTAGGAATSIYSAASACVLSLAVNASNAYWSENTTCDLIPSGATIKRRTAPTGAGTTTIQKSGLTGPASLHLTTTDLFWIDGASSTRSLRRATLP